MKGVLRLGKIIKTKITGGIGLFDEAGKMNKRLLNLSTLEKYGQRGVEILKEMTPKKGGKTADSWYYEIKTNGRDAATISFHNNHFVNNCNVAIFTDL